METGIDSINNLTGPRGTVEQVAERIREAIVLGNIPPGTRLLETQLATRLGVSRIPVREALTRLEAEGLVERAPYQGARVMRLTLDQVRESFMLRSLLEGFATRLATPHVTPEEIGRLRDVIAQLGKYAKAGRHEELPALAREIHSTIYNRCGSAKLMRWISELYNQFPKSQRLSYRFKKPSQEYRHIVDAIEAGDAELAGRLMSEHIENGGRVIVKHYSEILPT
jgi:DNA-binding GntR family transcriptional regulator